MKRLLYTICVNCPWQSWLPLVKSGVLPSWADHYHQGDPKDTINYEQQGGHGMKIWKLACSSFQQFLSRSLGAPREMQHHQGQCSGWGSPRWSACPRGHSWSASAPGRGGGWWGSWGGYRLLASSLGLDFRQILGPESGCRKMFSSVLFWNLHIMLQC